MKIPAKIVLSRLPVNPLTWQRMNLFRAGVMDDEASARSIFMKHLGAAEFTNLYGKTILELGPGNGLLTGKFAAELGAERTWLIDAFPLAEPAAFPNTVYLSDGLSSLRGIESASVDFIFSNAVLEHVRLKEFADTVAEMKRVLKPDGICSHQIDFRDHLGGALNNLRFSEGLWESDFMADSGFYTNRIPWSRMAEMFVAGGFAVNQIHGDRWPSLPTKQRVMAGPYRRMNPGDLLTWECHALMSPIA